MKKNLTIRKNKLKWLDNNIYSIYWYIVVYINIYLVYI